MALLNKLDQLIDFIDENKDFGILELEDNILYHIFGFLIDEAPLEDSLVLTCKKFRYTTYNHPIRFPKHYHVRIDPIFIFSNKVKDDRRFQIGAPIAPATKQAVVINNINGIINNKIFPFQNMRVFQFTASCTLSTVYPIFNLLKSSFRYLSFASSHFLAQNMSKFLEEKRKLDANDDNKTNVDKETVDFPPIFENCSLLTFIIGFNRKWNDSINLNGKFPQLTSLKISIENIEIIPQLQRFLDSVSNTVSMLFLEMGFRSKDYKQSDNDNNKPLFILKLPPNLEILSIYCAEDMNFEIDLTECHNHLKYLVALQSSIKYIHNTLKKNKKMKCLKYLIVNHLNDIYQLKWDLFHENDITKMYLPSLPSFSKTIQGSGDIKLYGHFPNVNEVRDNIENTKLRLLLRDLNNQQKRHFLWGYFWFEVRDKLKFEEIQLIKQDTQYSM